MRDNGVRGFPPGTVSASTLRTYEKDSAFSKADLKCAPILFSAHHVYPQTPTG
jgi:hypothetical protein